MTWKQGRRNPNTNVARKGTSVKCQTPPAPAVSPHSPAPCPCACSTRWAARRPPPPLPKRSVPKPRLVLSAALSDGRKHSWWNICVIKRGARQELREIGEKRKRFWGEAAGRGSGNLVRITCFATHVLWNISKTWFQNLSLSISWDRFSEEIRYTEWSEKLDLGRATLLNVSRFSQPIQWEFPGDK